MEEYLGIPYGKIPGRFEDPQPFGEIHKGKPIKVWKQISSVRQCNKGTIVLPGVGGLSLNGGPKVFGVVKGGPVFFH